MCTHRRKVRISVPGEFWHGEVWDETQGTFRSLNDAGSGMPWGTIFKPVRVSHGVVYPATIPVVGENYELVDPKCFVGVDKTPCVGE